MKSGRKTSSKALVLLVLGLVFTTLNAENLSSLFKSGEKWYTGYKTGQLEIKNLEKAMANIPGIQIIGEQSKENQTFACITHNLKKSKSWADIKNIMIFAKADKKISLKLNIACEGGTLDTGWLKKKTTSDFARFDMSLEKMKKKGSPDITKVKAITIGFGLWQFDTTKKGFSITLTKLETQ
jgi:hypothetical protein